MRTEESGDPKNVERRRFAMRTPFRFVAGRCAIRLDESRVIVSAFPDRIDGTPAHRHVYPIDVERGLRAEMGTGSVIGVFAGRLANGTTPEADEVSRRPEGDARR